MKKIYPRTSANSTHIEALFNFLLSSLFSKFNFPGNKWVIKIMIYHQKEEKNIYGLRLQNSGDSTKIINTNTLTYRYDVWYNIYICS